MREGRGRMGCETLCSDHDLMRLVRDGGSKDAFETLALRYRAGSVGFAFTFLHHAQDAEDAVQDCLARLWIHREDWKPADSFKPYLYAAIRNRCIDLLRSRRVPPARLDELEDLEGASSPETEYIRRERLEGVAALINGLRDDYRTALYLTAVQGMRYDQAAAVMKKSVPQVKITLFRARKKLKTAVLEGEDSGEK